jgi:hypothetical protein
MGKALAAIDISSSPEEVWQLIGGFNSLPDWLSYIPKSELSEAGRVRHLTTLKDETIVERLEVFDNTARSYSYSIIQAPFPVTDYLSTLRVTRQPVTEKDRAWSGLPSSLRVLTSATSKFQESFKESSKKALKSWHLDSNRKMKLGGAMTNGNEPRLYSGRCGDQL